MSCLSSMGKESRGAVAKVLSKYYEEVAVTIVDTVHDLDSLAARKPDLVFLGMKFIPVDPVLGLLDPNRIWVAQYLDDHGIAYTGSGHEAHILELNKQFAKRRIQQAGLATSRFHVVEHGSLDDMDEMSYTFPLFVKPTNKGGGVGIDSNSIVHNLSELNVKIRSISVTLQADSLVEAYLPGREFSVAILKDEHLAGFTAMPIELVADTNSQGERILSRRVKSLNNENVSTIKEGKIKSEVTALALDAFHALGGRDYGRIDIRLDRFGVPHFLEANLLPSLIDEYGSFPKACMLNKSMSHELMILRIVRLGLMRVPALNRTEQPLIASGVMPKIFNTTLEPVS